MARTSERHPVVAGRHRAAKIAGDGCLFVAGTTMPVLAVLLAPAAALRPRGSCPHDVPDDELKLAPLVSAVAGSPKIHLSIARYGDAIALGVASQGLGRLAERNQRNPFRHLVVCRVTASGLKVHGEHA